MAELNMLERIGNWFDASLSQQKFINQMRDEQNRYNDHHRNKELAELEKQQDAAITAAKQQYAGDKEALKNALNKIDGEFKAKKSDIDAKYPKWSSTNNDVAKAKSWQSRKNALEKSTFESDDKAKMEEVFGKPGESSDTGDQGVGTDSASTTSTSTTSTSVEKPDSSYISNNVMSDIANTMYGMDPSGRSDQLRKQAQMHDVQAADEQKNSQRNMQVANRDARAEADKDAVAQAASKNAQTVNNLSSATGAGAAALNRTVETGDPNTHRQRSDQQHAEGVKNQREMWGARQTAEEERGSANITDYQYRQAKGQTAMSDHLSQPVSGDTTSTTTSNKYTRYEKEETEDDGEETKPQTTKPQATAVGQQALNYVLGYLESDAGIAVTEQEKQLAESVLAKYPGIQRVRPGTFQYRNLDPALAEGTFITEDQFGGTPEQRKALMDELRVLRSPEDPAKNTSEADAYDASASHAVDSNTGALIDQTSLNSALTNPLRR